MSDSSQERSPRFTRAILGRVIAVLLFVALGTFAVIQIMGENENPDAAQQANLATDPSSENPQPSLDPNPEQSDAIDETPETSNFQPTATPTSFSPSKNQDENDPSLSGQSFSPPKQVEQGSFATQPNNNSFNAPPPNQIAFGATLPLR